MRTADGGWIATEATGLDAEMHVATLGNSLALREIYEKIDLVAPLSETEESPHPPGVGRRAKRLASRGN